MTASNQRTFYRGCRGCKNTLQPYGIRCHECGHRTPMPVTYSWMQWKHCDEATTCTLIKIGRAPVVAWYVIEDGAVSVTKLTFNGTGKAVPVNRHYTRMIESVIAKARGIL